MAANVVALVEALATLSTIALNAQVAMQNANEILRKAQEEGRDVTQAEIDEVNARIKTLRSEWDSL